MSNEHPSPRTDSDATPDDLAAVREAVEANEAEVAELLEQLAIVEELAAELAPELQTAVQENREPIRDLRVAFEREETMVLLERVGQNADTLTSLLETLEVVDALLTDLTPELRTAVQENRGTVERLRFALEREETLVLVERLGENADTFVELLDLLDATHDLADDLVPELAAVARDQREPIRDLRMLVAGLSDAYSESEVEPYQLGQNLGRMLALGQQLGDQNLVEAAEAGLGAFTDDEPPKKVGFFGLLAAMRDPDVRRGIGTMVDVLRRMGASRAE